MKKNPNKPIPVLQKKVDILNRRVAELSEEFSSLALSGKDYFEDLLFLAESVRPPLCDIASKLKKLLNGGGRAFERLLYTYIKDLGSSDKLRILSGFVFFDEETKSFIFLLREFASFLHANHFYAYGYSKLQIKLRELGAEPVKYYINKKPGRVRAWRLSAADYLKLKEKVNKK
jgi:hypothetical protein